MATTKGQRAYPNAEGHLVLAEGEYGQDNDGVWHARAPGNHMGDLSDHEVVEHADETITVSPSILIDDGRNKWHGYLKRGVWEEC